MASSIHVHINTPFHLSSSSVCTVHKLYDLHLKPACALRLMGTLLQSTNPLNIVHGQDLIIHEMLRKKGKATQGSTVQCVCVPMYMYMYIGTHIRNSLKRSKAILVQIDIQCIYMYVYRFTV